MHPLELRYLTQLMEEQIDTQKEIKERSSALLDGDLTIDEAVKQRQKINLDEEYLDHLNTILSFTADQGFLGYNHPGGLTTFFYGYTASPPSAYAPGCYARKRG